MFPFIGLRQSRFNQATVQKALEKLDTNELKVEDILEDDDLVSELRSYTYSQLMNFLTQDRLIEFVNYIINEPESNDHKIGYQYPFNACEVLCSENIYVINKLFDNINKGEEKEESIKNSMDVEEGEFSGRRSIMIQFSKASKEKEEDYKNLEINDLDNDIVEPEVNSTDKKEENLSYGNNDIEKKIEEIANTLKDSDKNFLDSLESKEDVVSVTKEPEQNENNVLITPEYPVIDHLFNMLNTNDKLNYVLAGYFFKFFNHLSQYRHLIFMKYLLLHKISFVYDMINHLNRKSIADCISKFLVSYVPEIEDSEVKKDILEKIIISYNPNDEEVIRDFQTNRGRNQNSTERKDSDSYTMENYNEFEADSNFKINSEIKLKVDLNMKNYMNIFNTIFTYLEPICKDFMYIPENSQLLQTTFEQDIPRLGIHKTIEFEYIQLIFELAVNVLNNNNTNQIEFVIKSLDALIDKFISLGLFETIVEYFFKYEWNSIYQNLFVEFVACVTNKFMPEKMIEKFFSNTRIIDKIIDNSFTPGLSFKSGVSIFPGYFATICEIADIINKNENLYLQKILSTNDEWKYVSKIYLQPIKHKFNKGLLNPSEVESPFKRYISFNFKEPLIPTEDDTKFSQLKVFSADCSIRFDKMKLRKENQLQDKGNFDIDKYFLEELESMRLIEKEAEDLTISLQSELLKSINVEDDNYTYNQPTENHIEDHSTSNEQYFDNNFFWRDYKIDVDLSEL